MSIPSFPSVSRLPSEASFTTCIPAELFDRYFSDADLHCPQWLDTTKFQDIVTAVREAFTILQAFLERPHHQRQKTAIVFDIDDTLCYSETKEPILPVKALYRAITEVRHPRLKIFIVSARPWCFRRSAKDQLRKHGYGHWYKTYFVDHILPRDDRRLSVTTPSDWLSDINQVALHPDDPTGKGRRKADVRQRIESFGYNVLMNIGDDPTDHLYGCYQHAIRLPQL